ncbi:HAMP domain-containing protein [Thiohalocapsa marina]|uniref:histidine kinase n=1 Tax=Thiohalocapsa marina TaxID=424902 RepID=A0A5M8FHW8_9GAMM|nr:ATP-binding protein [Thiohalocapsa marina]KAA6184014.1 HAMP domain-containing protein [Thiohalocapsa marina]
MAESGGAGLGPSAPARSARRILSSFTFRLVLLYVLLLGGSAGILLGFIYWSTAGYMARQTDLTIGAEIQGLAEQYRRRGLSGLSTVIAERVARDPSGAMVYLLADGSYAPLVGNIDTWPGVEPDRDGWIEFRLREAAASELGGAGREHRARAKVFRLRGGQRLLVGRDVRELTATRDLIQEALAWGLAITAGLALLGAWFLSGGVLRRIEAVNQVCREIMEGDLSRRVPTDGSGDELDRLALNLNRMLARIEELMSSVRQVSDNIAHDLRTPLSRLHTKLSQLRDAALPGVAAAQVEAAINDAEELLSAFNALLRIARVESGARRAAFGDLDLAPLLSDVAEFYEPLAADKGQQLRVELAGAGTGVGALRVHGDRDLLFQAIANLLDNAIKYTPAGGRIGVRAMREGDRVQVDVSDSGPGIPAELRDKVLQRFFRVDASRSAPGHGLGLSLVQAVAQLHGAELRLDAAGPGLRVSMRLPAVADVVPDGPRRQASGQDGMRAGIEAGLR